MKPLRYLGPILAGLVTLVLMLAVSTVVFAQDDGAVAASSTILVQLTDAAFRILVPVVTLFAMWGAHRAIAVFEAKTKIDVPDKQEAKIDGWIEDAIHWAEEKSRNAIKHKAEKLRGPEKLESAADFVMGFVESRGWIDWTRAKIEHKIEAKLGVKRANGGKPRLDAEDSPDLPEPEPHSA